MAEATAGQITAAVTALLEETLDCTVERGWKDDPPAVTTAYVLRGGDSGDTGVNLPVDVLADIFKRVRVKVILESPRQGETEEDALDLLRDAVRDVVRANPDLDCGEWIDLPADGMDEGCQCVFVTRQGMTHPNSAREIVVSWRV